MSELEARGHSVDAPDLPCDDVDAGAARYAEVVGDRSDAVVVGHSLGGLTLPLVPARKHVFLAALVPSPSAKPPLGDALDPSFRGGTVQDEHGCSCWPDTEGAARQLYPELERPTVEWAFARLRPQAPRPSTEPSPLTGLPDVPRASVVTARDRCVRPDWQRRIAREVLGVEPVEVDAGHHPMLERPTELADVLGRLAEDVP